MELPAGAEAAARAPDIDGVSSKAMQRRLRALLLIAGLGLADITASSARAQATDPAQVSNTALAEDLENPIYRRITIPFQNNYQCCYVPGGGINYTLKI
jgi:hypothetical protein